MSAAGAGQQGGPVPGPREGPTPGRPELSALARAARREWGPLLRTVRSSLVTAKLRAIPLTLTAVCLTLVFQFVQNQAWGYQTVQDIGSVQAWEHLWVALLRTPLSLFVPALDLPVWGALAQILVVFGIAEICVGRRQTLLIAYVATLAGTMYARIGIWLGPVSPLGLPDSDKFVIDTGPSAAVVGLAVFVCWRYRAWFTCAAVAVAMVVEVVSIKNNLAGKEHVAAVLAVLVVCALWELGRPRGPGEAPRVSGWGRPR
ncbi:hypothetical protein [Streptomyces sp. KS_16]|uniref:hypothetical protein n=1 Tax=unclassified Streptomyces TaxID=2593676 RepID=UPI0008844B3A|nr:hypothetical protein BX261_1877 [Streptomyces sp. 2321.6]SDR52025.1 hypothetical protein SAMN05216511_5338 [Streptomyces sp. KS_16]SEC39287.1 hypothetical protein SAMN05428940_1879 [Streptomyces sp. 2133.1]SNC67126.1 hypothetical protein SAMN06272741_1874 [Streptomyces sp. 2114.4]